VQIDPENSFKTILPVSSLVKPKFEKISFSSEYMRDALEAHFKLNSEQLNIYFNGEIKPIVLDDEVQVKTLILPVRTY
jgi:DNA polymerase III sliding clamp (beta) subunit (PCNA family)